MITINYQPRDTKFYPKLALPIGFKNKIDADLRYFRSKKEYGPVILKEALVNGAFLVVFFGLFAWLNLRTLVWEYYLPFAALLIILFICTIYTRKVNKFHKRPQKIYEQVVQIFEGTDIKDNTLYEQSAYCFKFSKNNMDCEFTYNLYRKVYHLYIYPPTDTENLEEKGDTFVDQAKGKWIYDEDEDGFFLACTIRPDDIGSFNEILSVDTQLANDLGL